MSGRIVGEDLFHRIKTTHPFLRADPEVVMNVFSYLPDRIMNKRITVGAVMEERFTANAIKTIQTEHGTYPDKPLPVLYGTGCALIRKTFFDADMFEADIIILCSQLKTAEEQK